MAEILAIDHAATDAAIREYYDELVVLAQLAINGDIGQRVYIRRQIQLSSNAMRAIFLASGGDLQNTQAASWLSEQDAITANSARKLARDIYNGRYSTVRTDGEITQTAAEGLEKLTNRLVLWTYPLGKAYHRGHLYRPPFLGEIVGTWYLGRTEKHCSDCFEQNGETRTQSEWAALAARGIEPQGRGLECGGFRCDCQIKWERR